MLGKDSRDHQPHRCGKRRSGEKDAHDAAEGACGCARLHNGEQRRALAAKQRTLENALAQSRYLAAWLAGDGESTEGGRKWRVRVCPEEYFIEGAIPYSEDREEDFLTAVHEHLQYCEQKGWASAFQEAYRIDEAHAMERSYAEGLCAEERVPKKVSSDRLRVKPAGTYLQLLNHIDLTAVQEELGADAGCVTDAAGGSAGGGSCG